MSPKLKNARGHFAVLDASSAFGLAHTMPSPAGSMSPFCEPVTARSTRHSLMRKSMLPSELTASAKSSAGCCASSITWRTAARSLVTPVAVSLCTIITPRMRCSRSARRMRPISASGAPSPHAHSMTSTSRPRHCIISIHRWPNWPKRGASTRSPGESVLASAASHAPVPVVGKMNTWPAAQPKTRIRSGKRLRVSSGNFDERWSSIATIIERRIRSGMLVGPGTKRKLRPAMVFSRDLKNWESRYRLAVHGKCIAELLRLLAHAGKQALVRRGLKDVGNHVRDHARFNRAESARGERRGADAHAARDGGLFRVVRDRVLVDGDMRAAERRLGVLAGDAHGPQVEQEHVAIGAARDHAQAAPGERSSHCPCIFQDAS